MRTRWVLGALVILVTFASCGKRLSTGIQVDSALRRFIAPDTLALAGMDLDKIRTTPFYARHKKQLDLPVLNTFSGQSGLDFRRDLATLLLTWNGKGMVIAGRGNFDKDKIQQLLGADAFRSDYKTFTLFEYRGNAVTFAGAEVAVAGELRSVKSAIDVEESRDGRVPDELSASLAELSKADQIWVVSRGSLPFADMPASSERASILSNFAGYVKATSMGITIDGGLHFKAEIDCISATGAKRVNDGVRGGIGFARLAVKNKDLDLLPLYNAVHVKQEKQSVYLDGDLSPEFADKLLNRFITVDFTTEPGQTR